MASIFDYISDNLNRFKFLKWVQIIKTESEATKKSALYLLEKSSTAFEVIVTDDSGAKRKLSGNVNTNELEDLFAKLDASNVSPENAELWRGIIIGDLTDKSEDNSYNKFLTQNADGDLAVSDGRSMMIELPNLLTEQQKLAWKTAMNGGWTTNAMSVAMVSPLVIDNGNYNTWFALRGANLNLNPANFKITICDINGNDLIDVNNNSVQLYQNGLDLVFYYNFSVLGIGEYRIKIWNGISTYITNTSIAVRVVANITNIDLGSITWETHAVPDNDTTSASSGNGRSASIKDEYLLPDISSNPIVSVYSSPLGNINTNLYIDLSISFSTGVILQDPLMDLVSSVIGITYSDFDISGDVFNPISYISYQPYSGSIRHGYNTRSVEFSNGDGTTSYSFGVIFIKMGNILYLVSKYNNMVYLITIDPTKHISLILQIPNWRDNLANSASVSINRAFEF